ncbi:transposable element P transposase [Elysia marginata]|uniref:Transposable element P transposase n=1 Tax=Elysia marginata TaxID=1093978 RepID=A0AAV4JXI1_9GAST|nr:transposable element P transposase [Elysia marginata]
MATEEENSALPIPTPTSEPVSYSPSPGSPPSMEQQRMLKLKKKIDSQRKRIKRPQSSPSVASKQKEELATIKSLSAKYLSKDIHDFFCTQLDMSVKKKKRWDAHNKSQALSIYHASPKAYLLFRKIFHLPSVTTMRRTMAKLDIYPGFPSSVIEAFKVKVTQMEPRDRLCILVFDEMSLKCSLNYNVERDYVEGLEDFGMACGRTEKASNHATVFMARGLMAKWKQPFGYFLSHSTIKPAILHRVLMTAIEKLKSLDLTVKAVICDQGSNNCSVFRNLGVTPEKPYFQHLESEVLVIFDPPHLLKNIRNNLMKHSFFTSDGAVSWKVIREFFEKDQAFPLKMAPKLTKKHIDVPIFSKLRVNLAAQVLSHSVAAGIAFLCQTGIFPAQYMATSKFIQRFDSLFNVFNVNGGNSKAPFKHPITPTSSHVAFLVESKAWLKSLHYGTDDSRKPAESLPCIRGWLQTIEALLLLIKNTLTDESNTKYLLSNRLNQDCIENLFAIIRSKGGHRNNPDPQEFRFALRQVMVDKVLSSIRGTNCKEDLDTFLINFTSHSQVSTQPQLFHPPSVNSQQTQEVQVVNLVKSAKPEDIVQLENVVAYIGGYICRKLIPIICEQCGSLLQAESDSNQYSQHLTFIHTKAYDDCKNGGLKMPSFALVEALGLFEAVFQTDIQCSLRKENLRKNFKSLACLDTRWCPRSVGVGGAKLSGLKLKSDCMV